MYSLPSIPCTMRPAVYLGVRCIQHSIVQQHLVVQLAQAEVHLQRLALLNRACDLNGQGLVTAKQSRGARTPGDVCVAAVSDLNSEAQGHSEMSRQSPGLIIMPGAMHTATVSLSGTLQGVPQTGYGLTVNRPRRASCQICVATATMNPSSAPCRPVAQALACHHPEVHGYGCGRLLQPTGSWQV